MRNGEGVAQGIRRLTGGVIDGVTVPGIMKTTRAKAGALASTSMNAFTNQARIATFQQNTDVVKGTQQLSTLDNLTSDICVAYSGQAWNVETFKPIPPSTLPFNGGPPRHFNCRSTLVPVLKSFQELGLTDKESAGFPVGTRASMDGQVPGDTTFAGFLSGKSKKFQDKLLGPARAKLWRNNDITLTQLVDMRGNPMTVAQLEIKAGLKPSAPIVGQDPDAGFKAALRQQQAEERATKEAARRAELARLRKQAEKEAAAADRAKKLAAEKEKQRLAAEKAKKKAQKEAAAARKAERKAKAKLAREERRLAELETKAVPPVTPSTTQALPKNIPKFKTSDEAQAWSRKHLIRPDSQFIGKERTVTTFKGRGFARERVSTTHTEPLGWMKTYNKDMWRNLADVTVMMSKRFNMKLPAYLGNKRLHNKLRFKRGGRELASVEMKTDSFLLPGPLFNLKDLLKKWNRASSGNARESARSIIMFEQLLKDAKSFKKRDGALEQALKQAIDKKDTPWTVTVGLSDDATDAAKAFAQQWETLIHESGHRLHGQFGDTINAVLREMKELARDTFGQKWRFMWMRQVSKYSSTNDFEFVAESFVRYMIGDHDRIYPPLLKAFKQLDNGRGFGIKGISTIGSELP